MKKAIVVPIKTNNQRLPGKNTMILGDMPLYAHLFKTLQKTKIEVYVDSSDDEILKIAKQYGFKTIKRPVFLNTPETSGNDLINHALKNIECDILGQFFVTTPFLKIETIEKAFSLLESNLEKISSSFGLYPVYDRFWLNSKPVNHNYKNLVGTQYMNPLMRESGFYVFKKEAFLNENSRITDDFVTFEVAERECIDIDTQEDFIYASSIYNKGLV
jgi:CMP-N-acetylneuraminic acid synthetase